MATLEAAREAGVYGGDQRLFTGVTEQCRKKLFGLVNCCKKGGGGAAKSNNALMSAAIQGAYAGGQLAVNAGSKYMFDFMYPQYAGYLEAGAKAMISSEVLFTPTNFQPSFSFYGLTLSTGTMTSGLLGGPIFSLGSLGSFNFYFDPYSLAVAVASNCSRTCSRATRPSNCWRCTAMPISASRWAPSVRPGCRSSGRASNRPSRIAASTLAWPG
jgi:conjugal transfer mating pair stabilization protein TraN